MSDQAAQLRQLMWRTTRLQSTRLQVSEPARAPNCITVLGGEPHVGCTTVAVELSYALVEQGARVVLVDIDPRAAGVAQFFGHVSRLHDLPGVAQRDIHEALQLGPRGIQWVPGVWESYPARQPETRLLGLLQQLAQLGRHADWVVLDAGNASGNFLRILGNFADLSLFVTSTLVETLTRTYTLIKKNVVAGSPAEVGLFVNRTESSEEASEVISGFRKSVHRFLARELATTSSWLKNATTEQKQIALQSLATFCVEHVAQRRLVPPTRRAA
jgi:MinD-like ATPase involved in chromosome partitioning or flagellar assembly